MMDEVGDGRSHKCSPDAGSDARILTRVDSRLKQKCAGLCDSSVS